MPVKMQPTSIIKAKLGIDPNGEVQKFFTNTCYKRMDKYVPYDTGNLAYDSVSIKSDRIIYNAPYARYQYEGITKNGNNIVNKKSAGHEYAGSYWDKRMVSAEINDVINKVQNSIGNRRV